MLDPFGEERVDQLELGLGVLVQLVDLLALVPVFLEQSPACLTFELLLLVLDRPPVEFLLLLCPSQYLEQFVPGTIRKREVSDVTS